MNLELEEHTDREELDTERFENMGIAAKVYHDTEQNANKDKPNRHAIALGEDLFIVKEKEE